MTTDWIKLFVIDRVSMSETMRKNAASDLENGYSISQITRQMVAIEEYEKETDRMYVEFTKSPTGQEKAHRYLKKVGAIV